MEETLRALPPIIQNVPTVRQFTRDITEAKRARIIRGRNKKRCQLFDLRPKPSFLPISRDHMQVIEKWESRVAKKGKVILSLGMVTETIGDQFGRFTNQPLWIVLINNNYNVVYESLVKVNKTNLNTANHGITYEMISQARPLTTVCSQVLEFIAGCDVLVGAGIHNHLHALGLTKMSIRSIQHKFRDMTVHYSPRLHSATNLAVNALLVFKRRLINPDKPHPFDHATICMYLYFLEYSVIEFEAMNHGGVHNGNQDRLCGHDGTTAELNANYRERDDWPAEWQNLAFPYRCNFPTPVTIGEPLADWPLDVAGNIDFEDDGSVIHYGPSAGNTRSKSPAETQVSQADPNHENSTHIEEVTDVISPMEDEPELNVILDERRQTIEYAEEGESQENESQENEEDDLSVGRMEEPNQDDDDVFLDALDENLQACQPIMRELEEMIPDEIVDREPSEIPASEVIDMGLDAPELLAPVIEAPQLIELQPAIVEGIPTESDEGINSSQSVIDENMDEVESNQPQAIHDPDEIVEDLSIWDVD